MEFIRDYIYVYYEDEMRRAISSGIEFKEFIQGLSVRPQNILVLEGQFIGSHDFTTQCEYCVSNDIEDFLEEDVYGYGNFAWLDFDKVTSLETLEPREVAELYYLGKKWIPINNTYFHKLKDGSSSHPNL